MLRVQGSIPSAVRLTIKKKKKTEISCAAGNFLNKFNNAQLTKFIKFSVILLSSEI
jgi:hypothetical protein